MKRLLSLVLSVVLVASICPTALASNAEHKEAADFLYSLGLVSGTGTDANGNPIYELDRAPTRSEAITVLVKLLGKANEAEKGGWNTPFTDVPSWAQNYVGYAYASGLTAGTSATTFGGNDLVTAAQYITFVLKALGYSANGDFQWDKAWELSDELLITDGRYNANTKTFVRGDMFMISAAALKTTVKGSGVTLAYKLISDGAFTQEQYNKACSNASQTTGHTHKYISKVIAPTCEKNGYTIHTCDCGESYTSNDTTATGHNYTKNVVAPTTSAQGYTIHTCSNCGHSYKDNYTDKLVTPVEPKPDSKDDGEKKPWEGEKYSDEITGNQGIAGQFTDDTVYTREFYTPGMDIFKACDAINHYVAYVYGRKFNPQGIGVNSNDRGKFAKFVLDDNGRLGINVFGWRKSYDSDVATNAALNMVMEAFYFMTGDKEVAHTLWSFIDKMGITGSADTDDFGISILSKDSTKNTYEMSIKNFKFTFKKENGTTTFFF